MSFKKDPKRGQAASTGDFFHKGVFRSWRTFERSGETNKSFVEIPRSLKSEQNFSEAWCLHFLPRSSFSLSLLLLLSQVLKLSLQMPTNIIPV